MLFDHNVPERGLWLRCNVGVLRGIVISAAIVMSLGCNRSQMDRFSRVPVEGTVLLDERPLKQGVLWFIPADGVCGPKTSAIIADGHYGMTEQSGPVTGKHRVEIYLVDASLPAFDDEYKLAQLSTQRHKKLDKPVRLPLQYSDQSTLVADIESTADGDPLTLNYQLHSR